MKNQLFALLAIAVVALGAAGITFLNTASSSSAYITDTARTPSLVAGIVCLSLGTGVLVFGILLFRWRE